MFEVVWTCSMDVRAKSGCSCLVYSVPGTGPAPGGRLVPPAPGHVPGPRVSLIYSPWCRGGMWHISPWRRGGGFTRSI